MALPPDVRDLLAPLASAPHRAALLLDIDGTLAPIVPRAADAGLLEGVPELLRQADERFALLALVTGRPEADVDRMVGMPHVAAGMNHGMQLRRDGEVEIASEALPHLDRVRDFAAAWADEPALTAVGVWLEDKGPTVSFHYRSAPDQDRARDALESEVVPAAAAAGLAAEWGRRVLEIRPPVHVDKGTAVRQLLSGSPVTVAAYFGDDRTDANAWRELRELQEEGVLDHVACILARNTEVPSSVAEAADGAVDGPEGVREALRELLASSDG